MYPSVKTGANSNKFLKIFIDKTIENYIIINMKSDKTTISISVDEAAKVAAHAVAKSTGLTLSALVNAYFNQVAATRRIELYAPEPMTPNLEKLIAQVEAEILAGKVSKPFNTTKDFLADLNS